MRLLLVLLATISINLPAAGQKAKKFTRIHYFYNSGWLLETDQHILVFDFIAHNSSGISLAGLQQQLLSSPKNKKILIFITHGHNDHFDESVFELASKRNVSILLGWQPGKLPNIERLSVIRPGDSLVNRDYAVYTHTSTDEGSGFLVKVDGFTIYHAGDHALWIEEQLPEFSSQLSYIRSKATTIDIAFLPAARGLFVNCAYDSVILKGLELSVEILKPATIALQHIGCADKLSQYKLAREQLAAIKTNWIIPEKYDQSF